MELLGSVEVYCRACFLPLKIEALVTFARTLLSDVALNCLGEIPTPGQPGDTGAIGVKFDELLQGYFSAGGELFMPIPDYEAAYATVTQSCCNSFSTLT